MKLHLGCGKLKLPNYVNIDISSPLADMQLDIRNLKEFDDNTVNEIYVCHVLEHFKRREITTVLLEWNRILKKGGLLRISVPDFEKVVKMYNQTQDISNLLGFLNGGQKDDYDCHYCNFDIRILTTILKKVGFDNIQKYDINSFLNQYDDYSKCYLPHMDPNGELMSLNIICFKADDITTIKWTNEDKKLKNFLKIK